MSKSFFNNADTLETLEQAVPWPWQVLETDNVSREGQEVKFEFPIGEALFKFSELHIVSGKLSRAVGVRLCPDPSTISSDVGQYVRSVVEDTPDEEREEYLQHIIYVRMRWPLPNDIIERLNDTREQIVDICSDAVPAMPDQVPAS